MIMHFLQATTPMLFYISLHLVTETISRSVRISTLASSSYTIRWHEWRENGAFVYDRPSSASTRSVSSTTNKPSPSDSFSRNFRIAAMITAGIALILVVLRLCMLMCHRASRTQQQHHRHRAMIRPQVAIIESHYVKPDLPPAYLDAIAQDDTDGNKLPSYDEVQDEQMSTRV